MESGDKFIEIDGNTILLKQTSEMFTKCRICRKHIQGGETIYEEMVTHNSGLIVKPPMCADCAKKKQDNPENMVKHS